MPKRTKAQVLDELKQNYGYSENQLKGYKYVDLLNVLKACEAAEDVMEDASPQGQSILDDATDIHETNDDEENDSDEDNSKTEQLEDDIPDVSSPEWQDYVFNQFTEQELENKCPKTDGLRRVAELLMGPFGSKTIVESCPSNTNSGRATVVVELMFRNCPYRNCSGASDVFGGNTQPQFASHAVATAETRAEGRALRRALRLTNTLSAEEASGISASEEQMEDSDPMPDEMKTSIQAMANKTNIDLPNLLGYMGYNTKNLSELTKKDAQRIADKIGSLNRDKENIPDELKST